jgi:hypothetical protein
MTKLTWLHNIILCHVFRVIFFFLRLIFICRASLSLEDDREGVYHQFGCFSCEPTSWLGRTRKWAMARISLFSHKNVYLYNLISHFPFFGRIYTHTLARTQAKTRQIFKSHGHFELRLNAVHDVWIAGVVRRSG